MISSDSVGFETPPVVELISARRLLAFAAGIGDPSPAVFDDLGSLQAAPTFCVSLEWPLMSHASLRERLCDEPAEMLRGVHVLQDSHFARPIEPGMRVSTSARVTGLRSTGAGSLLTLRVETGDEAGLLVTSWIQTLFRGVELRGSDRELETAPSTPEIGSEAEGERVAIPIARELPHVYTECARIWNPIHTERRVAKAAGLPDIILHGTATWALAGRELIARHASGDPSRLRRLRGRFRAMVLPGTPIELEHAALGDEGGELQVGFSVRNAEGESAIEAGLANILGP